MAHPLCISYFVLCNNDNTLNSNYTFVIPNCDSAQQLWLGEIQFLSDAGSERSVSVHDTYIYVSIYHFPVIVSTTA